MSTKFGIITKECPPFETDDIGCLPEWLNPEIFTVVAYRSNGIRFTKAMAQFLPNDTKVYPLDNSAQEIYTIGDIKNAIKTEFI